MTDLRVDVEAVRSLAGKALDGADRIAEINWPTLQFDAMPGSAVAGATAVPLIEERAADVVRHMRGWAAAAQASATATVAAQLRHARELGDAR